MLPRTQRLHTAADFRRVRGGGKQWRSTSFLAFVKPNHQSHFHVGLVVSAKIGKAVIRKRASRILREGSAHLKAELVGKDIVFIARPMIKDKTTRQIEEEIRRMSRLLP